MEVWDLALDEVLGRDGVGVVEWADRAQSMYDIDALTVTMEQVDDPSTRVLEFDDPTGRYRHHLEVVQLQFAPVEET